MSHWARGMHRSLPGLGAWAVAVIVLSCACAAQPNRGCILPASPLTLVVDVKQFLPFALQISPKVATELRGASEPAELKLFLGLYLHLALETGNGPLALATAARIRALQSDPGERELTGLTTIAVVDARKVANADSGPAYRAAFEERFGVLLATIPRSPAVRAALVKARERAAATDPAALVAEVRHNLERMKAGETCSWLEIDQIVRARHRLSTIVPLREALVRAYDVGLARQAETAP